MSQAQEVRIPDIGDIDQVEVIEICVAVGDSVTVLDPLIVIESDKASMEVPAGVAGTVASIDVALGDQVAEGALVVTLKGAVEPSDAPESVDSGDEQEPVQAEGKTVSPAQPPAPVQVAETVAVAGPSSAQSTSVEVRVPDIGEATNVEVIEIAVTAGAEVSEDDLLVVVESDKASMEIPAGHAGVIEQVAVEVGAEVIEGTLLAIIRARTIESVASEVGSTSAANAADTNAADAKPVATHTAAPTAVSSPVAAAPTTGAATSDAQQADDRSADSARIYAGPAVRRLARELGVQLKSVAGTGNRGRILKDDVKGFVKATLNRAPASGAGQASAGIPPLPAVDFSKFGAVEMQPLTRIRAAGAANLHRSWLNLPHVTQFEEADVTELEAFRQTLKEEAARRELKITPLAFIVKACCYALQAYPTFNASLDPGLKNFVLKKYYHIGFAVDTTQGLVVPVIKDADTMGVWELSAAIAELAEKARTQSLGMSDMQGGSFSISSLGNIGGTGFTPIINAPEVAILGVSKLVTKPIWDGTEFLPRQMLPLSLSYDHRAINGAEAGRFMVMLAELLGDIRRLAL